MSESQLKPNNPDGLKSKPRRKFFSDVAKTACSVGLVGLAIGVHSKSAHSLPSEAIRPPGALPEDDFLAACTRCGICVNDCPYDILKLAEPGDDIALGTPYFTARTGPCEMCEDIPCIPNCPTGALDHALTDINQSRMGLAVLIDQETCIAFHGLRCEICFNVCPVRGDAITLTYEHNERSGKHALFIPVVHSEACTGCGLCERACIMEEASIKVLPIKLAKGQLGEHYRLGWKQKEGAGSSLVSPDVPHQYNLPEGVQYDLQGKGLIMGEPADVQDTPFSSNPMDALNKGFKTEGK